MNSQHSDQREHLLTALQEIERWEQEQRDLSWFDKIGRLPFKLLDRFTPKIIQRKIGQALDELGNYFQTGGSYLISEAAILRKLTDASKQNETGQRVHAEPHDAVPLELKEVADVQSLPLAIMDRTANELSGSRANMATWQGATTGIGGWITLSIDIPAVLGLSLKIIQEIAICYGFDPKDKAERVFAVKVLQFTSSDIIGKQAILEQLAGGQSAESERQLASELQGWREVTAAFRDNYGWKKLFQMIPIAGMVFGAFMNRGMMQDVAEAARMMYRKRRILMKLNGGAAEK
ncbi:EcsC family protein [Paenibacillus sp. MMS18-CY102]|uniref:EcsC family protein n=1 Tax=Paenibacillus sp. MMS18-CY102 TaxID=2682849 RepID=UPI0013667CFA|nr:EcsC family protein [Paenibacillus sp. MMS18-CY102]MWC27916.1 EcsC family protein [Paenibacillus sp. MMS18-CY102]